MDDVFLVVDGIRYAGWKAVRVTRSIESLAGSFALDVSDRFGYDEFWPIAEEDPCRVEIDGVPVISGYIDKRDISASDNSRALSYSGRDRAAALVDCSAALSKWTYYKVSVADFVREIAAPFGVDVTVATGLALPEVARIVVSPGDTAQEAIKRATGEHGVLLISDGAGRITITLAGSTRAASLIEGENIKTAQFNGDCSERFHRYVVITQIAGTDEASGNATRVRAEAIDAGVRRTDRVLIIRPEKGMGVAEARARADWEARIRAAKAAAVTITVQGWRQPNGELWPVNALTRVRARKLIGIDGDMVIAQAEYSISGQGRMTQLRLLRPDAFTPEPTKATVESSAGRLARVDQRRALMGIDLATLRHLVRPIVTRIANSIARGVVQVVSDEKKMQLVQLGVLDEETVEGGGEGAEHFQPYGFSSVPLAGAEAVVLFPNGDRSHPIVIAAADRRYRPTGGEPGQVDMHHYTGSRVTFLENGNIELQPAPGGKVIAAGANTTTEGVVVGTGVDPFTGATYFVLGNSSTKVFAKK